MRLQVAILGIGAFLGLTLCTPAQAGLIGDFSGTTTAGISPLGEVFDFPSGVGLRRNADGSESEVPVAQLKTGDRIVLRPGDHVPTDGEVLEGDSAVDESMLTGESKPVDKALGNRLYAGTVNLNGRLLMRITATGEETALAHVIAAVQRAQTSRARIQLKAWRSPQNTCTPKYNQYITVIGLFQQIKSWELDVGFRHLQSVAGRDIVLNSDNTIDYPRSVRENNDSIEAGFSYTTSKRHLRYGFHSRTVFDGSNTDRKFWVGASLDIPFGGTQPE